MTFHEIKYYLDMEHVGHTTDAQITRMGLNTGEEHIVYFTQENQKIELMKENKWIVIPVNDPLTFSVIEGSQILYLKSGRKAFK